MVSLQPAFAIFPPESWVTSLPTFPRDKLQSQPSPDLAYNRVHRMPPAREAGRSLWRNSMTEVTREEIQRRLADGSATVVNVLSQVAWDLVRIPGSIHLPLEEIERRAREVLPDLEREIIVYCGGPT